MLASMTSQYCRLLSRLIAPLMCDLPRSADLPVYLVECLLDITHSLQHLAFHLLRSAFRLQGFVTSQFAKLLLDFARYILGSAFHLIAVHGVLLKLNAAYAPSS